MSRSGKSLTGAFLAGVLSLSLVFGMAPRALADEPVVDPAGSVVVNEQTPGAYDGKDSNEPQVDTTNEDNGEEPAADVPGEDDPEPGDGADDPVDPIDPDDPTDPVDDPTEDPSDPIDISLASTTLDAEEYVYDGTAKLPVVTVTVTDEYGNAMTLEEGVDFTVSYENNTNAGTATVTITGVGDYAGEASQSFSIAPADITSASVATMATVTYNGSAHTPSPAVTLYGLTLEKGTDYALSYSGNKNAGTATVTITGKGNYTGAITRSFTIKTASIRSASVSPIAAVKYNGKAQTPNPTVKVGGVTLKKGTDYTLSYKNNKNAGTATVTITGKGNYAGSLSKTFTIKGTSIANAQVSNISAKTYNGRAQGQNVKVVVGGKTLKKGTDYTVSYRNNVNAGTASITIRGTGAYIGTITRTFKINPRNFANATVASIGSKYYTGSAITPAPVVKWGNTVLKRGTDYTVSYKNNKNAGTATVIIKGKGNYSGVTKTVTFKIVKRNASRFTVGSVGTMRYTGSNITPNPTVKWGSTVLRRGTDYTVSYKNNRYAGTATITITGKGLYTGTKTVTFRIAGGPRYYGTAVYVTDTGSKYHRAGCRYLQHSKHKVDKGEAIYDGYEPCKVCKP